MKHDYHWWGMWSLRVGLALTYLYSGFSLIISTENWLGFIPSWFNSLLPVAPELYLKLQGAAELLFSLSYLTGFWIPVAASFSILEFSGILVFYGIDLISFRDIALLGSAIALFFFFLEDKDNG